MRLNVNGSCSKCDAADNDNMVQCDTCDQWFHFECVGVDDKIKDSNWVCDVCPSQVTPQCLDTGANNARVKTTRKSAEKSSKKGTSTATKSSETTINATANIAATSNRPLVENVVSKSPKNNPTTSGGIQLAVPSTNMTAAQDRVSNLLEMLPQHNWETSENTSTRAATNVQHVRIEPEQKRHFDSMQQCRPIEQIRHFDSRQQGMPLELKFLEEEIKIKEEYLKRKYEILRQLEQGGDYQAPMHFGPSPSQIAARQVLPKELPEFNGDPEDWPLFLSTFENTTNMGGFTNAENLIRLQVCLKGKAKEMVKSKLLIPSMVPEIITILKTCFGRPEIIIERMIEKAKQIAPPKDKLELLIDFGLAVKNITSTIEACNLSEYLNNPLLVKEFVEKLPNQYKLAWAMQPPTGEPVVIAFSKWLFRLAEAASKVVTPTISKAKGTVNLHATDSNSKPCIVCKEAHKLTKCAEFKKHTADKKWEVVKQNKLCRQCLKSHRRKCFSDRECGVDGCTAKHNPLLHQNSGQGTQVSQVNTHNSNGATLFRIVPVKLKAREKMIDTFAFLDEGSSVTLIEEELFSQLGVNGVRKPLHLKWTGATTRHEDSSLCASIQLRNADNGREYTLKGVQTVKNLNLPTQTLAMDDLKATYPYLQRIPIRSYTQAKQLILIGADNWNCAVPLKTKEGASHQPIATKTRLGWALQGCTKGRQEQHCLNYHLCDCEREYEELHELVRNSFELEAAAKPIISKEDNLALEKLRATYKEIGGKFEIGLPWRHDDEKLPNSYNTAYKRLICLQRKFKRDNSLKGKMQAEIDNLLRKKYARKLSPQELLKPMQRIWYLPIFVTANPNKPNRIRLVWDAAAKSDGRSLNDFLLSGPDLLTPLVGILLSFRVGRIAISGDIAEMFHQIRVRPEDMHAQRFLWQSEEGRNPDVYVMEALTFGTNCAPCIAHFIRNLNADRFEQQFPRAAAAIKNSHYVDDFIDSADSMEETLQLAKDVRSIHASAGFHIHKWVSNCADVTNELNKSDQPSQAPVQFPETEKVLGMYWDPSTDQFRYLFRFNRLKRDVLQLNVAPTKREVLQVLMSVYDLLGFVSCYTVRLKILLQSIWRSGLGWDDDLDGELLEEWNQWKNTLKNIAQVKVPRCFSPLLKDAKTVELHTFVDAGENAYSASCYLRIENEQNVDISLAIAKVKVAPLKPVTIPRLELQAAVMGVRLALNVNKVNRIPIASNIYWTDSKTVLNWLRMDPRRLKQFVMFRIGEILEQSNLAQWKWVPTKLNPADLATKKFNHNNLKMWYEGPDFLRENASFWPICNHIETTDENETRHLLIVSEAPTPAYPNFNVTYFSEWRRLQRYVAVWILYFEILRNRCKGIPISPNYIRSERAITLLYRQAQLSTYSSEIQNLTQGKSISTRSKLISLNPYIDKFGILRMRSRVVRLTSFEDVIILPKEHHTTFLIVRSYHDKYHHQLHEAVVNEINTKFYIPQLRVLYKTVRKRCSRCKLLTARPNEQLMAALPKARLAVFQRPFTCTGIDFFGPFIVSVGRRREKRWGVIFTCLTVRAIHIETAHSLNTSSCVMCIQNFISRRGTPKEFYTDNGTNFRATEKLLREHDVNIDYPTFTMKFNEIQWFFNPPAAPHMGGAWERLIRSIKSILTSLSPSANFTDETFRNALCEVEFIINSRPLTFVSLEVPSDEALTPNHFLLGSAGGYKPLCDNATNLRECWKRAQAFADLFWQRWIKEYSPIIGRRGKWYLKKPPLEKGNVVIIVDEKLPRNCWPKGIIEEVLLSKDGQVRKARVRTQYGIMERPSIKLALLDVGK